jgi:hypothetical protein
MERVKVVLLGTIAAALLIDRVPALFSSAHAQSANVACQVFRADTVVANKPEKIAEIGAASMTPVRDWLAQNPGQLAYRASYPVIWSGEVTGYLEVVCVR